MVNIISAFCEPWKYTDGKLDHYTVWIFWYDDNFLLQLALFHLWCFKNVWQWNFSVICVSILICMILLINLNNDFTSCNSVLFLLSLSIIIAQWLVIFQLLCWALLGTHFCLFLFFSKILIKLSNLFVLNFSEFTVITKHSKKLKCRGIGSWVMTMVKKFLSDSLCIFWLLLCLKVLKI